MALAELEKPLSSIAAQLFTLETYDEEFGVYDSSTQQQTQFLLNAQHEAEDMSIVDPFDRELEKYLNANVLKYTGISFETYMSYSRDKCEKFLLRCDALATKEAEEAEAAMKPTRDKLPNKSQPIRRR